MLATKLVFPHRRLKRQLMQKESESACAIRHIDELEETHSAVCFP
jgi:hypothetical protein